MIEKGTQVMNTNGQCLPARARMLLAHLGTLMPESEVAKVLVEPEHQFWINDPARADAPIAVSWDGLLAAWGEFAYRRATVNKQ
jgi:hypothetical protein